MKNRRVLLVSRPPGGVPQAEDFRVEETTLAPLEEGRFLVRNDFVSVEPAMRGWISDKRNYSTPVEIGSVMRSVAVGEVVESRHPDFKLGEVVTGWFGWQQFAAVEPGAVIRRIAEDDLPRSLWLGVLGINGVTALIGLTEIGQPKPGETLLVSTAAGSVGSAVGQIGKIIGCRTVGITGGPEKAALCANRFGYDAVIDYRAPGLGESIEAACPTGVDVYFDNTSGAISDAVYPRLAIRGRVVICGTASISSWDPWPTGPRIERHLLVKRARAQGLLILDYADQWEASVATLADWVRAGRLRYEEEILEGLESSPDALAGLYRGENKGKRLIRVRT